MSRERCLQIVKNLGFQLSQDEMEHVNFEDLKIFIQEFADAPLEAKLNSLQSL
jgi:hypothetical protein